MKYKIFDSLDNVHAAIPVFKTRLVVLDNKRICLARTQAGLFAVEDTCPHLGESLSKGTTNYLNEVVCPWHSYRFSLNHGAECKYRTRSLNTYVISMEPEGIFIEIK